MKGSLRQRSPGSWELTVDQRHDALGKRRRKHLTYVPEICYSAASPAAPTTAMVPRPPSASRCRRPRPPARA